MKAAVRIFLGFIAINLFVVLIILIGAALT